VAIAGESQFSGLPRFVVAPPAPASEQGAACNDGSFPSAGLTHALRIHAAGTCHASQSKGNGGRSRATPPAPASEQGAACNDGSFPSAGSWPHAVSRAIGQDHPVHDRPFCQEPSVAEPRP
jgi:hypothetical protein